MSFQEEVAKIFKEAREKQGLTQEEVAKKAKMNTNYYAQVERGTRNARGDVLNRIANALGIKLKLPLE
ncbi:MAG TPA: helix-turn-helix transcriptional regulator [Patescibacteria group bacterium]|nr:helix-turn-helix transcriptional regulator [Patescibacteria group bacterium]